MFHVSQLKKFQGHLPTAAHIPQRRHGTSHEILQPDLILETKLVQDTNAYVVHYLVQWKGCPSYEATWVPAAKLQHHFPSFTLPTMT